MFMFLCHLIARVAYPHNIMLKTSKTFNCSINVYCSWIATWLVGGTVKNNQYDQYDELGMTIEIRERIMFLGPSSRMHLWILWTWCRCRDWVKGPKVGLDIFKTLPNKWAVLDQGCMIYIEIKSVLTYGFVWLSNPRKTKFLKVSFFTILSSSTVDSYV